jgi:BMFP domain-containing protein YqiC
MVIRTPSDDFPFDEPASEPGRDPWDAPDAWEAAPPRPPDPPSPPAWDDDEDDEDEEPGSGREPGRDRPRHERVLHTRISERLSDDIRRAADDLRVPVSNLVRNVLEEAFGAVERVSDEVGDFLEEVLADSEGARGDLRRLRRRVQRLARRQRRRFARADEEAGEPAEPADRPQAASREPAAEPPAPERPQRSFPEVLGWQPLLLNAAAPCAGCDRPLAAGERVLVGASERGLSRTFLCGSCARARQLA